MENLWHRWMGICVGFSSFDLFIFFFFVFVSSNCTALWNPSTSKTKKELGHWPRTMNDVQGCRITIMIRIIVGIFCWLLFVSFHFTPIEWFYAMHKAFNFNTILCVNRKTTQQKQSYTFIHTWHGISLNR